MFGKDEGKKLMRELSLAQRRIEVADKKAEAYQKEKALAELPPIVPPSPTPPVSDIKKPPKKRRGLKGWQKVGLAGGITFVLQYQAINQLTPMMVAQPSLSLYYWTAEVLTVLVPLVLGISLFIQGAKALHVKPPKITAEQFLAYLKSDDDMSTDALFGFLDAFREKARVRGRHLRIETVDAETQRSRMQIERSIS